MLEGEVLLGCSPADVAAGQHPGAITSDEVALLSLVRGQSVLLPACLGEVSLAPRQRAVLLDIYLP